MLPAYRVCAGFLYNKSGVADDVLFRMSRLPRLLNFRNIVPLI